MHYLLKSFDRVTATFFSAYFSHFVGSLLILCDLSGRMVGVYTK